jgi:hypothetical protein
MRGMSAMSATRLPSVYHWASLFAGAVRGMSAMRHVPDAVSVTHLPSAYPCCRAYHSLTQCLSVSPCPGRRVPRRGAVPLTALCPRPGPGLLSVQFVGIDLGHPNRSILGRGENEVPGDSREEWPPEKSSRGARGVARERSERSGPDSSREEQQDLPDLPV